MCPADQNKNAERGYIIPIGGAEEKLHNPEILDRFVDVCGGQSVRISIIPTASELEDTGRNYEKLFRKLGVKHAKVLPFETREDCGPGRNLDYIEKSDGVFLTGGNQLRLSTTLGGTEVAQMIRRRNAAGMHVAGTSAGAAFMPEHMIAGGHEGSTPSPDLVTMAPGLGLTNKFIIDQHFQNSVKNVIWRQTVTVLLIRAQLRRWRFVDNRHGNHLARRCEHPRRMIGVAPAARLKDACFIHIFDRVIATRHIAIDCRIANRNF